MHKALIETGGRDWPMHKQGETGHSCPPSAARTPKPALDQFFVRSPEEPSRLPLPEAGTYFRTGAQLRTAKAQQMATEKQALIPKSQYEQVWAKYNLLENMQMRCPVCNLENMVSISLNYGSFQNMF